MPQEKTNKYPDLREVKDKVYLTLKDIGSLKEKILLFLAENPDKNTQALQKELGYPSTQYPNIMKAVKALEKLELVQSKTGKSMKNVQMKIYSCTEEGVFYVLTKNSNANVLKILDSYKDRINLAKSLRQLYDLWGPEVFIHFLKDMSTFLPLILKEGWDNALPYIVMKGYMGIQNFNSKKRRQIGAQTLKHFPQAKKFMEEWKKNINEIV